MDTKLGFTVNEQNVLAEVCSVMQNISHSVNGQGEMPADNRLEDLAFLAERFSSIRWDDLYDRFHRSGVNA